MTPHTNQPSAEALRIADTLRDHGELAEIRVRSHADLAAAREEARLNVAATVDAEIDTLLERIGALRVALQMIAWDGDTLPDRDAAVRLCERLHKIAREALRADEGGQP